MRVGAFELHRKIGAGGMGEIWEARHVELGVPAAVKFDLHPPDDTWRDAFLAEVRRIAELDHPNVVHLFDSGVVTASEASATDGFIAEGMPWLAMELARGGSLADSGNHPQRWDELLHVFIGLLRALAHAHARDIVHRDIKPGNLLLAGPRSSFVATPETLLEARVVLSDFGIGHDRDRPGWMDEQSVGTPRFMAPEQIEANWRDQGPWTDLYQTGILIWRLACGRYPYAQRKAVQLYRAHLLEPLPAFEPIMDVPAGLEPLLRRLLEKDWRQRPAFCQDVIDALLDMGPPVRGSGAPVLELDDDELPTVSAEDLPTVVEDASLSATTVERTDRAFAPRGAFVLDLGLRGAGLGLWGLRPPPLVGRRHERARLGDALQAVRRSGEPGVVVLRGAAGVGKSRLLAWIGQEAHEAGQAHVLRVAHPDPDAETHGIRGMFLRELRLYGLERDDAEARIRDLPLDDGSRELLTTWLLGPARPNDRMPSLIEQLALLRRYLNWRATDRPALVTIDDAHFGAIALRLVTALVRRVRKLPVLFVFAVRDDLLPERPEESRRLQALVEGPRCEVLPVGPLREEEHRELVRKMLGLEGSLAAEVERRTAGNPAFAVQLVNAWVQSGRLVVGPEGFCLEGGLPDALPADLLTIWEHRVETLARTLPPTAVQALELAALLGVELDLSTWVAIARSTGIHIDAELLGRLVGLHVLSVDPRSGRVRFTHGGLREALLGRVRASGREPELASLAADHLQRVDGDPGRLAELLLAAGRLEEAIEPLKQMVDAKLNQGDLRSTRWLDLLHDTLRKLKLPRDNPQWGSMWLLYSWLKRIQSKPEEADHYAARAERAARKYGWKDVLGWALREAGMAAFDRAQYPEAIEFLLEAEDVLEDAGRIESAAWCRQQLGAIYEFTGDFDLAEQAYRSCLGVFVDNPRSWVFAADPWIALAQIYQKQDRLDEALDHAEQARIWSERMGQHTNLARIALLEGEIARRRGDLDAASDHYRRSAELYEAFHDPTALLATLNLAVVGVLRDQFEETRSLTETLLKRLERTNQPLFAAFARSVLVACCAALHDEQGFYEHIEALETFLDETGVADPDIAKMAEIAIERARSTPIRDRARELRDQQLARLGQREE